MPRILNAKQAFAAGGRPASKRTGIPKPGQSFRLFSGAASQNIVVGRDGMLVTPNHILIYVQDEHWTLVAAQEEGTYHIKNVASGNFVTDGHTPDPVFVGEENPVTVRISEADEGFFVIKAPNKDLLWTVVGNVAWFHIEYKAADGSPEQLWRFVPSDDE